VKVTNGVGRTPGSIGDNDDDSERRRRAELADRVLVSGGREMGCAVRVICEMNGRFGMVSVK
jgi:hypothetical protein